MVPSATPPEGPPPVEGPPEAREPDYLISGTGCVAGHVPGHELDAGRLGVVPTRRRARLGLALVVWCIVGAALLAITGATGPNWTVLACQVALIWLAFAAFVVRSAGHRGQCWRTRTWRHAWGGIAPGSTPSES